jgi:oxygen-independent coproporphyrinogen-3 oxidase
MPLEKVQDLTEKARFRLEDFRRLKETGLIPLDGDFFPYGVHYPPITMYPPTTQEELFRTFTLPPDGLFDIYVHIPFCIKRCLFCHYPSLYSAAESKKDEYLDALEKEMEIYMGVLGVNPIRARSILIGGGTPTDLTPAQLKRFLEYFCKYVDLDQCKQFNYDVDPATLVGPDGLERLRLMRDYGVDRLTIGVQSLNEAVLKRMNRSHDAQTAIESVENSIRFGYKVNIEFIFGHPGETLENWVEVLEKAVRLGTPEIQFYRLKVEPYGDQEGSIKKFHRYHPDELPTPEETILMKQIAIDFLAAHGYTENLRRVFTKKRSDISLYAFNQCCQLLDEIGFGLTAFSSLRDRFGLNTQYFKDYYSAIQNGRLPLNRGLVRNPEQQMRWSVILPLKNYFIRKSLFERVNGVPLESVFQDKFSALKSFQLIHEDDSRMELTQLGAFFADEVVQQFCERPFIPFPEENYADGPLNPYTHPAVFSVEPLTRV